MTLALRIDRPFGAPVEGLALAIALDGTHVARGVTVRVWLRNVDAAPREVLLSRAWCMFRPRLRREDGAEVQPSAAGRSLLQPPTPHMILLDLFRPGREHDDQLELTRLFDLTAPGRYVVAVEHDVRRGRELVGTARSNEVSFELHSPA